MHYLCNTCGAYLDYEGADQHSLDGHDVEAVVDDA